METLADYLIRLMRQKHLTPVDLSRRCGLTDSYIGRLCKAPSSNLTVETITKLAGALEVNPHEIFTAASGIAASETPSIDPLLLLEAMQKLITEANGFEALQQLLGFSLDERKRLLDYVEYFKRLPPKGKGKLRKKGKPRKKKD
jgi:transcriptional regulator with XRE-family HTH domain